MAAVCGLPLAQCAPLFWIKAPEGYAISAMVSVASLGILMLKLSLALFAAGAVYIAYRCKESNEVNARW
jgi:hypothetical protein